MDELKGYCGYCGEEMNYADRFCGHCGKPVYSVPTDTSAQPPPTPSAPVPPEPPPQPAPPATPPPAQPAVPYTPPPAPHGAPAPPRAPQKQACNPLVVFGCCCLSIFLLAVAVFVVLRFTEFGEQLAEELEWQGVSIEGTGGTREQYVTALAFSIDADVGADPYYNLIACGTSEGNIHIFDATSFGLMESFSSVAPAGGRIEGLVIGSHWDYVESRDDFNYNGEYILWTGDTGAGILSWEPRRDKGDRTINEIAVGADKPTALRCDPFYDSYLDALWVFNTADQAANCWDCALGQIVSSEYWDPGMMPISRIHRSTNGRYTALEFEESYISVSDSWETTGGMLDFGYPVYAYMGDYFPTPVAFSVSSLGHLALAGGVVGEQAVIVHDVVDDKTIYSWELPYTPTALAFSFHGDRLAIGGQDSIQIRDIYRGGLAQQLTVPR